MGNGAAQCFCIRSFSNGGFYQIRPCKKNRTISFHHHGFIAHDGQISAAGNTRPHNSRQLGNAHRTHAGIVSEYSAEMFFVRKYLILQRQKHTGTVDKINDRQMIFHGNLLHTEIFFPGNRKPCTCFYRLIIGQYDTLPAADITNTGNRTSCRTATIFFVHIITGKCADLIKFRICVQQIRNSFPGRQFIFFVLFVYRMSNLPLPQFFGNGYEADSGPASYYLHFC